MRPSDACGWPAGRYAREGATWVIRSHFIEYPRPAFAGESLSLEWGSPDLLDLRNFTTTKHLKGIGRANLPTTSCTPGPI